MSLTVVYNPTTNSLSCNKYVLNTQHNICDISFNIPAKISFDIVCCILTEKNTNKNSVINMNKISSGIIDVYKLNVGDVSFKNNGIFLYRLIGINLASLKTHVSSVIEINTDVSLSGIITKVTAAEVYNSEVLDAYERIHKLTELNIKIHDSIEKLQKGG